MTEHTLYWNSTGPKISYGEDISGEYLTIEDLNPENKIMFRLRPTELLIFGLKCIWRSMFR